MISGGEGRVGDWLLENALARFVVRDTFGSLTQLGETGGTLVDATQVGEPDLLGELLLDGDRSEVSAVNQETTAELRLPGLVYHLEADVSILRVGTPAGAPIDGLWVPRPGVDRTQGAARGDRVHEGGFFALDGRVGGDLEDEAVTVDVAGQVAVWDLTQVAVQIDGAFPGATLLEIEVDADFVEVSDGSVLVDRVPVMDGAARVAVPDDAVVGGARDGCTYDGLERVACAGLHVRVTDGEGEDLAAAVHFSGRDFALPEGGAIAPLGPVAGVAWIWAGPGYSATSLAYAGVDADIQVVLERRLPAERTWPAASGEGATFVEGGTVLAALDEQVAPDASHGVYSQDLLHSLRAEGVGFVVARSDGEMPVVRRDVHDKLHSLAATGVRELAYSWSWSATTARPGHGAPNVLGLGVVDQLALLRGGAKADRFTVVTPAWVEAALAVGDPYVWNPQPDALLLASPLDLPVLDTLLDAWIPVVPIGPRTWIEYTGSDHTTAFEAGLRQARVSAGNGPRVVIQPLAHQGAMPANVLGGVAEPFRDGSFRVTVAGPAWMNLDVLEMHSDRGIRHYDLPEDGVVAVSMPLVRWAYAIVYGERSYPWGGDAAWGVSAVAWVNGPS